MPADYIDMPAHIATRVAVAADRERVARMDYESLRARWPTSPSLPMLLADLEAARSEVWAALSEAREAERVTVERVKGEAIEAYMDTVDGGEACLAWNRWAIAGADVFELAP